MLRHLILLPAPVLAPCSEQLADVLLVDRLADGVLADDVVVLPDRLADGVAAFAHVLLVDRLADGVAALLHHRVVDRPVADAGLVLDHGLVADPVADASGMQHCSGLQHAGGVGSTPRSATPGAARPAARPTRPATSGNATFSLISGLLAIRRIRFPDGRAARRRGSAASRLRELCPMERVGQSGA